MTHIAKVYPALYYDIYMVGDADCWTHKKSTVDGQPAQLLIMSLASTYLHEECTEISVHIENGYLQCITVV